MSSSERKINVSSNFCMPNKEQVNVLVHDKLHFANKNGRDSVLSLIRRRKILNAILQANPSTVDLILLVVIKKFLFVKAPLFVFDLILKNPQGFTQKMVAALKGFFLRRIDFIFVIHKDTSGYQKYYGLKEKQFIYIPFKANNFDIKERFEIQDEGYIVSLGASQRDYATLIEAARGLNYKVVIICSDKGALEHNANIGVDAEYPENLTRIRQPLERDDLYNMLARSSFVVIPILATAIQPAGVSVYLESMIFKKAVIISEGASANGILHNEKNALIVPAKDPIALRSAMQNLIALPELKAELAEAGYEYAFSLSNDARLRENLLLEILAKVA